MVNDHTQCHYTLLVTEMHYCLGHIMNLETCFLSFSLVILYSNYIKSDACTRIIVAVVKGCV